MYIMISSDDNTIIISSRYGKLPEYIIETGNIHDGESCICLRFTDKKSLIELLMEDGSFIWH